MAIRPTNNLRPAPGHTPAPAGNGPTSPGRTGQSPDAARLQPNPSTAGQRPPEAPLPQPGAEAPIALRQDRHGNPLDGHGHEPHAFGAPTSPPRNVPNRPPQWRNLTLESTRPQREMLHREGNHNIFEAPEMAPRRRDLDRETTRRTANGNLVEPMPGQAIPPRLNGEGNV